MGSMEVLFLSSWRAPWWGAAARRPTDQPTDPHCQCTMAFITHASVLPTTHKQATSSSSSVTSTRSIISLKKNLRSSVDWGRAQAVSMSATTTGPPEQIRSLRQFLEVAKDLDTIRFITVTVASGAVLETIGRFDYKVSTFSVPGKGDYVTIASDDKLFECHLNTSKLKKVTLATEKAKIGDHDLHVMRFMGEDDALMLSCLLMYDPSKGPGNYLFGSVQRFQNIIATYGNQIVFH